MANTTKRRKVKKYNVKKEISKIDQVFRSIKNNKSLPSFVDFYMECIIRGNVENVNLRKMYPIVYKELHTLLKAHRDKILTQREN